MEASFFYLCSYPLHLFLSIQSLNPVESSHVTFSSLFLSPCPPQLSNPAKQCSHCNGNKYIKYVFSSTPTSTVLFFIMFFGKYWPIYCWGNLFFFFYSQTFYLKPCLKTSETLLFFASLFFKPQLSKIHPETSETMQSCIEWAELNWTCTCVGEGMIYFSYL